MSAFIAIKLLVLLDRNSNDKKNVAVSIFWRHLRHLAASMSILTRRNVSTVGEFGTYICKFR